MFDIIEYCNNMLQKPSQNISKKMKVISTNTFQLENVPKHTITSFISVSNTHILLVQERLICIERRMKNQHKLFIMLYYNKIKKVNFIILANMY